MYSTLAGSTLTSETFEGILNKSIDSLLNEDLTSEKSTSAEKSFGVICVNLLDPHEKETFTSFGNNLNSRESGAFLMTTGISNWYLAIVSTPTKTLILS